MTDRFDDMKTAFAPVRAAMYDFEPASVRRALDAVVAPDATMRVAFPFGTMTGPGALFDEALAPLFHAVPDLERRDHIVIAGDTPEGACWLGCGGYYTGLFARPFLNIPPTRHQMHMRFHEFYRFEGGRIVEMQALWDIPEVMMQAGAWPLAPSLGREWHVPGPATQDGLVAGPRDAARSDATRDLIIEMLEHMKRHPGQGGPEVMEMPRFWHERMSWYGPSGIGTGRGVKGFRDWHQIPFLSAMPDRGAYVDEIDYHFFGDGAYAAVTGWPNMIQTVSHGGWLGIAPSDKRIAMRSLDFWRVEAGRIRENWVMVDLLDAFDQLGVDVLARMREFNKARAGFDPETGRAVA
ncbi:SnoaL-like domain protein [Roseivivax jejudonensis]|uniref:SnoaL-like domain protein n=1 Tax=Roseivivax jejudonensis TaxID=1529041 RepID=A0A1X6YFM8_9RHOB|nr:ester cyclase [Roseivivax jejudonensis]SLN19592.1 SnoaL-like domain protein [Roseivivax jejudonensis]